MSQARVVEIRPLTDAEAAVNRFVEELWLPYHRELERIVDRHQLAETVDLVAEERQYRRDRLQEDRHRTWLAVDVRGDPEPADAPALVDPRADLAGFVSSDLEAPPPVFDRPDRAVVNDLYVREPYRRSGLGRGLVERVERWAVAEGCTELVLDVAIDNDRAATFYEELGFAPYQCRMAVEIDDR